MPLSIIPHAACLPFFFAVLQFSFAVAATAELCTEATSHEELSAVIK